MAGTGPMILGSPFTHHSRESPARVTMATAEQHHVKGGGGA